MIAPARRAAFAILLRMEQQQRHADDLLHGTALARLSPRDRALATTLVMGTLRWQLALDAAIFPLLRKGPALAPEVAIALRMGLLQLWHMDRIPAHAALSESVELVKASGFPPLAGLVNALLRKLQRQTPPEFSRAARLAHPAWMVERWAAMYGNAIAQTICEADQRIPATALRADYAQAGRAAAPGALLARAALLAESDAGLRAQDEGSQLVAEIAAAAAPDALCVLDACAAPGGKTAILAERLRRAKIYAVDISRPRLKLMRGLMPEELAGQIELICADAAALPALPPVDLMLCDAPCSGTGTLARNPEIRLRLQPAALPHFGQRQRALLAGSWQRVRPGGTLVYSTCSLEPEENEQVARHFLSTQRDAVPAPLEPVLEAMQRDGIFVPQGLERLTVGKQVDFLRTLPGVHPCDGFFVALFRKT